MTEALQDMVDISHLADRQSLCAVFQETVARVPDRVALRAWGGGPELTWAEYGRRVRATAAGLRSLGVDRGSTLAIMLTNSVEFHVLDTAALHVGAATVSVYNTLPADDIEFVLRDSGAVAVVCDAAFVERADDARRRVGVEHLVVVNGSYEGTITLDELEARQTPGFDFDATWRAVRPDDLAVLIYTSGATGAPKGVELTHRTVLGNQQGLNLAIGIIDGATTLSFLPMAHAAERHMSHYRAMVGGLTVTTIPDLRSVPQALTEVRPDYFFSPPRLWEKFQSALTDEVAADDADRAALARLLELGRQEVEALHQNSALDTVLAEELAALRSTLGGRLLHRIGLGNAKVALTGAAPVSGDLVMFYVSLGLPILEAWGLSECGAFGAFNRPGDFRVGTVGKVLPGVELRLLDDGEILLRSPWLMRGYRNSPAKTAEVFDADGWLHTGDVGVLDKDGFLSIVDRKKDIMINAAGKNMSPANIEAKLRDADPLIAHAVVVGEGRPYNVALIVLAADSLSSFATREGLSHLSLRDIAAHPVLLHRIEKAVDVANSRMSRVEQIKKHLVLPTEWQPASDELTPTMKLRRRPVNDKYAKEIECLYE
ncbi:AMP-dependent synthetase/ligase [Streptomyces arenae]|uniref:AMP-dependent synthetase/ligase n=1 Tax=Streptomyces arenae TaxID=29301 RepID=UPI0026592162|nr:AMP-dependent synthetase/ligase [Streptomyces arenae]MCG7207411.1 AMP-dependent synthetase/ligase [Streptomyces arenae]